MFSNYFVTDACEEFSDTYLQTKPSAINTVHFMLGIETL